ncbi:MFS transporter [Nocardia sputi]|uniref:MFS transporter n=1 Tax=Nocardia sputi TaxID=2943705 RepID=UPI0020BF74AD|nr:MFS transporter [Nocardia sputi]
MTPPQQFLDDLPNWLTDIVFGNEVPQMRGESGRRSSAAWAQAGTEYDDLARRLREVVAALPDAVRGEFGDRITASAVPMCEVAEDSAKFCHSMSRHTDRSAADSDKEVYVMYAFGALTLYQLLLAGGVHPIRGLHILTAARAKHLTAFRAFVASRLGAGAAAAVERAGPLLAQVGGFAIAAGGVDLVVQAGQIAGTLDGHRDSVDWNSVLLATATGGGSALGGVLSGYAAHAVVSRANAPVLLGRAVVGVVSGVFGVIGGASTAAALTGEFRLSASALVSGVALGMAGAGLHARARSEPPPSLASHERAGPLADLVARPDALGTRELRPADAEPVRSSAADESGIAVGRPPDPAESVIAGHGDKDTSRPAADGSAVADRESATASTEPVGDPNATLYERINALRDREFAETEAAAAGAVAAPANISESIGGRASETPTVPGAELPSPSPRETPAGQSSSSAAPTAPDTEIAASGSVDSPAGPDLPGTRHDTESVADLAAADSMVPQRDPAEVDRLVAERDDARAELATLLGISPQELRWWGHEPVARALDENNAWQAKLAEQSSFRAEPGVRERELSSLGQRMAVKVRAGVAEARALASVLQWAQQFEPAGQPTGRTNGQWPAVRAAGVAERVPEVGRLLDGVERYRAADARVAAVDPRAADGTWDSAHPRYRAPDPRAEVTGTAPAGAGAAGLNPTGPGGAGAGRETAVGAAPSRDETAARAGADESLGADPVVPVPEQIQQLGAAASAEAVSMVRAADFAVLGQESTRAGSALARWLGLSDTEFYRMSPTRLRAAVEFQVERAERLPEWGEQARASAGELIGDTVRRGMAADAANGGGPVGDPVNPAQTLPAELLNRLQEWVGENAAPMQRWMEVHATRDRLLDTPALMLRLESVPADPVPVRGEVVLDPALKPVRELRDLEAVETRVASRMAVGALTPEAAAVLARSGLAPTVPAGPIPMSVAGTPPSGVAPATARDSSGSDGTGPYSAPEPSGTRPASSSSSAALGRHRADVRTSEVDPAWAAAVEQVRDARQRELAETAAAQTDSRDTSTARTDVAPSAKPSGTSAAANSVDPAPTSSAASESSTGHSDAAGRTSSTESASAHGDGHTASQTPTPPAKESTAPSSAVILGAGMAAMDDDESTGPSAPLVDSKSATTPLEPVPVPAVASDGAADTVPRVAVSTGEVPGDPADLRRSHAEATARAAELLGVAPQELRLWGRELLEQVIDRFTAWSSPSGGDGWNQLSPAAQQGLRPEVGELFGRQLREVAEVHRQAAAALDWLRAAELVPDGTAVPVEQRLAELRRLADAHGPSSPLHETVDVLDRYLTLDDRVAALPPEPLIEQAAASDDAAKTLPRVVPTVHDEPDEPDRPVDVRQSHAELAARAGELLQVAPQELRLWGRALLERVIDRFEFWSNPSGSDGWSQLSPTEQAGLAQDLPTLLGRWLRDLAEAHRTAAPVLDWLRTAGLEPDGTAVPDGRRLAELRRLAAEQGPSAQLHELADVLDGYLKIDAEVAAMPPEPIPAPNLSADRSNDVLSPSATPTSSARPRQSLGESWWFASPLRGEWIEVGHTLGEQARTLAREHGVEVDHWALRSDSPELARLRAERAARTAGLAELIGMSAEELTLRRIDEVRAEAAAEIEARSATQPPGTAERVIDLAEACLLMAALAGTAARFHWLSSRVGAAVPGGSGDDQRWLAQVIKLGPAELHRRMQVLGIPTRPVWSSPPVASSMPPRAVSAPGTVDSPGRVVRPDRPGHRPAAAGGRGRPTVVHRRPSPSDARPVTARITPGPGRRRPLAPIAGTGLSGTPDGAGEIRPPDVLPGSKPIDCAVHTFGYLSQENPNIAENLAGAAPTPDPGLGGTDGTQLLKALGGKRWVQFRTWLKIVDLLDNLGPGAAAYVVIESRRARRISGTGHARLVFHDRAQPGVIKWRDPLVEGGAKQVFEPGKFFPSGDLLFAVVYGADGAVYSVPEESTGISDQTGSSPRRAVAGVGDARHPEGDLGDHVRWLRADAAAELERQAVLARDTLSDIDLTHEVHGVSLARLRDRIEHIDAVAAALAEAAAQHQRAAAELTARIVECRSMDDEAGYQGPGQLRDTRMLRDDVRNVLASLLRRTDRSDAEVANATAWLRELDAVIDAAAAYEYRGDLLEMFERELADLDLRARLIHTTRSEFAAEPTTADPAPDLLQRLRDEHTAFDDRLHGIVHRYVDRGHADPGRHVTQARQQARFDADDLTQWLRQSAPFRRYQLSDREFSELLRPDSAARAQWRHALIARQDQLIRSVPYEPEPFASEHDRMRSMAEDLRHRADLPAESAVMFEDFDARFLVLSTLEGIDRVERRVERIDALGAVLRDLRSWLAAARAQGQTADILAAEFDRIATSAHRFARLADEQYRLPESDDVVFSSLAAMRGFHYWQLRPGRPEHQRLKLDLELVLSALISFVGREVELDESARLAQRYRERWDHSDHAAKWLRTQLRSVLGRAVDGVDGAVLAELAQLCRDGTDPFSDSLRDYLQSMSARWYLDLRAIARQADLAEEHRRLDAELDHVLLGAVRRLRGARYGDDRDSRPVERTFTLGKHLAGLRDTAVRTRAAAARVLAASGRAVGVDAVWHVTPGSETLRRLDGRLERARTLLAELWQCAPAAVTGDLVDQRHAELESISNSTAEAEAIAEIRAVEPVVDAARQFHRYDAWARATDALDESINVARWEEAHSETAPADDAAALRRGASLAAWTASLIRRAHLLDDAASARAAAVAAGRTAEVELRDSDLDRLLDAVAAEIAERAARLDGPVGSTPDGSAADTEDTPQPLPPDARRAVVRSVDRQRAELRRQLDDLLRPLAIDSAQLLDIGSPVWAHWSAQHGQARDDLIRLLWPEVEPGRVADWWLHRMVLHRRELGDMPAELAATAQRFIESHAVSELLDAIGRADRWARTIETVEQELTWRSIERRRRAAAVRELRRAPEGLRSPGAPVPDIETALASMIKQDDVFQRMDGQLDRLYRLGIAIADVQRRMRSLAPTRARLVSSMLEYGMAEPDSRPAMLFGNARLTHLAARPRPEPPRASGVAGPERDLGELLWESRMLAGLDDQLYWLNADLEASLDELTSELAGVPAAAARPQGQVVELPGIGLIWGALDWVRVDVAARRRLAVAALTAGPSAEFGIDTTRLDTGRDGEWGLTRLTTLRAQAATVPAQAEQLSRLDTAIGLVRTVIRTTAQVDAIDIVAAALDDANRRLDRIEQRFARLSADHLLRHPLDGRAIRATTRTQAHALRDAALWCGQPLEHAGWDVRPDQLRQRMNTARAQPDTDVGASEIRLAEVAERYLGLRGLEDVFDERSQLIQWIGSLKSRVLALYHNVAFRHIAERWSDMQRNMPRRPADTVVAEPTRPGRTPDRPRRLRHMLTRALHQLVHTLGPNLVHDVHKQSRVPSAQLDMHRVLLALIELDRLTVRYPQLGTDAVVRRAHRCQRLCLLVAAAEQTPLLVESHDDDQEFGKLVRSTLAFAVRQGDEDDDLPPITLPPTGHDLNRCARLVLEMHQHETGRPTSGDLSDTGLGGVLAGRYLRALGAGRPTRYAIDPDKPLRRVVAALHELVRDMSAANRSGVSIITIEGTHAADEHGVAAHTRRWVYRCDEQGNNARIELQDPGKALFGTPDEDKTNASDLTAIWAVAFDKNGNPLPLPGGDAEGPPQHMRVGRSDEPPPSVRGGIDGVSEPSTAERAARLAELLPRAEFLDFAEASTLVDLAHALHPEVTSGCLAQLSELDRRCVEKLCLDRLTPEQAARQLDKTPVVVERCAWRGASQLAELLFETLDPERRFRSLLSRVGSLSLDQLTKLVGLGLALHRPETDRCLARLSHRQRQFVELRIVEGLRVAEIARNVGTSRSAVSRDYGLAVRRVAESLVTVFGPHLPAVVLTEAERAARLATSLARIEPLDAAARSVVIEDALLLHHATVIRCLAKLTNHRQRIVRWRFLQHLDRRDVAGQLGTTIEAVQLAEHAAARQLVHLLAVELGYRPSLAGLLIRASSLTPAEETAAIQAAMIQHPAVVRRCLQRLGAHERRCVETIFAQDYDTAQVAAVLGLTAGDVEATYRTSVHQMVEWLAAELVPDAAACGSADAWMEAVRLLHGVSKRQFSVAIGQSSGWMSEARQRTRPPRLVVLRRMRDAGYVSNEMVRAAIRTFYTRPDYLPADADEEADFWDLVAAAVGSADEKRIRDRIYQRFDWVAEAQAWRWLVPGDDRDELAQHFRQKIMAAIGTHIPMYAFGVHAWVACVASVPGYRLARRYPHLSGPARKLVGKVGAYLDTRFGETGVEPDDAEIAAALGLTPEEVAQARSLRAAPLSLDAPRPGGDPAKPREFADGSRSPLGDFYLADAIRAALADLPEPDVAADLIVLCYVQGFTVPEAAARLRLRVDDAQTLLGVAGAVLRTDEFREMLAVSMHLDDALVRRSAHASNQCAVLVAEFHQARTGRPSGVDLSDAGLAGVTVERYLPALGAAQPQRFPIHPGRPLWWVEQALLELVQTLDPADRAGVSVVTIEGTWVVDEHGVSAHTRRIEYECDEEGGNVVVLLQDVGKDRYGTTDDDRTDPRELSYLWAAAFDKHGNPLLLPGADVESPPGELRIGHDADPPSADEIGAARIGVRGIIVDGVREPSRAERAARLAELLARTEPLDRAEMVTIIDDASVLHPKEFGDCLAQLPGGQRECFTLRYQDGLSEAEVATQLHKTRKAVWLVERRMVRQLVSLLREELGRAGRFAELLNRVGSLSLPEAAAFVRDALALHPETTDRCLAQLGDEQREIVQPRLLDRLRKGPVTRLDNPVGDIRTAAVWRMVDLLPAELERHARLVEQVKQAGSLSISQASALIETACELRPKATTWCLPQLDDAERRWVELRYLEGLGRAEVATRLGVATESVEHAETSAVLRLLEVLPGALDRPARFAELMVRIDSLSDAEAGTLVRIALDMHPEAADRCLARLPETERECIRLRFRDELTRAAAAPRLKKPRQAVEQIEAYAAQRFVQLLPDELDQRRRFAAMVDRVGSLTRSEQSTFVRDALDLRREAADRCFAQLPAGQHECARLRFVAKLSRKEVADRLGTTTDAVKKSEGAAVSRLVQLLPGELYPVRRLAGLLDRVGSLTLMEAMTLVRDALALHPQETARCFAQLPSAQRETLRLRFMDGHSREAAAAQLGLTEGRVAHSETQGVWRLVALLPGALGRPRLAELLLRAGSLTPNERLAVVLEANAAHPGVIRNGLNRLAEDRRRCAELRIVQNLNDDEAAAELGTTVASVMALYQHAERQLVEWLAAELIPDPAAFDSAVEWVAAIAVFHGESRESFSAAIGRHHVWLTQALAMNSDLRLVSLRKVRDAGYISNAMLRGAIENFYLRQQYRVPAEATEEAKFWELIDAPVGSDKEKSILDSICRKFDGIAIAAESKWWRRWDRDHGELAQFFRRVILGAALQHVPPFSFSVHAWASCRTAVNRYYVEVIYAHLDYENATLVSKVDSYISKQLKKTGHEPDDEEIARALGLTVSDVVDAKRMGATSETSIDAPVRSDKPNSRAIDIGDPARPETDDVEFRDELLLALADMPNPALAAALVELCHVRDIPVADVAGRLRIDVTAAQALLAEAAERLRTEEFRAQLVAVRTRRMIDEVADASVAAEAEDGRPRHAVDDGTVPYRRPDGAMHDQCGRRVLELHGMRTGRSFVVPEPDGLAGSSLKRLLDAVGGRPQWFAVDPVRPRRLIDRALTELLRSMDSAAREGVSLLVAEIWQIPDGDGVMGHLDRAEYHCAADGSNGWLEEQDPGSGRLGRWGDSETGTELAGYVVSAFDPHGESVLLPGTAVVDLHDRFRVGRSDEERASKRAFFFLKWIRGLSRSSSPKKKADATLKRLNTGSISSNLTSVGLSTYSPLLVQQLSNSMQLAGLTASAGQLVTLLAKPAAGYIADRFDNRRTIQISSTAGLATSTAAGAAVLLGLPGAVPIVIGSALAAAATNTVGGAATTTYGRRLVDQDQQTKAVTISLVGRQTSATAGKFLVPAIGSVSPALPFFADAATYALYLERLRKLPSVRPDPADRVGLLDGARAMWADSYLRGNVLLLVPWNIGNAIGAMQLVDFIAASDYAAQLGGLAPLMSGCLLAAGAAGTLLAVMTVPERIRDKINLKVSDPLTMVVGGVLATSFVLTPNPWVILPLSIAVGAGSMLSAERYFLYQQKIVPQKMIGGAMSVNGVLGAIGSMVGGALGGFLLSTAGAGITGWLASGLFAATSVASGVLAYATRGRAVHGVGSSTTTDLSARDVAWWSVATDSRTGGRINFWDWEAMRDELPPAKPVQRPPVDIRQLRPDDWRQDRTITLTALASAPEAFEATVEQTRTFSPDEWRDGVQRSLAAFVAFQDGVPIGKVAATAYDDADTVQLASLFVVPEARGRDVADRLIRSVVDWAWRQGFSRVAVRVREEDERAQRACGRNNFGWSGREGDGPRGRWIEMHRLLGEASWIEYTPMPVAVQPEPDGK